MAQWNPPNRVGLNEQIGRRLFDEPMLKGAGGQPSFSGIAITHFEETRDDGVSLDRLGASGIDRKVARYLQPRAEADAQKRTKPRRFDGWAVLPAKELINARRDPKLPIVVSPIDEPEPNDNLYHAHVERPEGFSPYTMALHLRYLFTQYGRIEQNRNSISTPRDRFLNHPLVRRISKQWMQLLKRR